MRENKLRRIWAAGGAVVNGWLSIPDGFSAETMAHHLQIAASIVELFLTRFSPVSGVLYSRP